MNKQAVRYPILLLDADDTLFDFQAAEQNALQRLLDEVHYPYTVNTLFQYRNINEDLWRRHEAGEITKEELQATRFTRFFDALSISGDGLAANNRYLEHLSEQGCLVNGALEVCRKLSAFCRLYICLLYTSFPELYGISRFRLYFSKRCGHPWNSVGLPLKAERYC